MLVLVNQSRRLSQPPCRWCRRDERRSRNRIPAQNHCGRPHLNAISYSSNVNISKMRRTTNAPSHRPLFSPSPTDEATGIFPEPAAPAAADAEEAAEEAEASEEPGGSLDVAEQAAQAAEQLMSLEAEQDQAEEVEDEELAAMVAAAAAEIDAFLAGAGYSDATGQAVQVDPIIPTLTAPETKRLKL